MKRCTARLKRMAAALALAGAVCSTRVMAVEPAPVERTGSTCPSGYRSSGVSFALFISGFRLAQNLE
jgi:hypothetical protein